MAEAMPQFIPEEEPQVKEEKRKPLHEPDIWFIDDDEVVEQDPKEVERRIENAAMNRCKDRMRSTYGIRNLRPAENLSLRKHTQDTLKLARREFSHFHSGKVEYQQFRGDNDITNEIVTRWLKDYDLDPLLLAKTCGTQTVTDLNTGEKFVYELKDSLTKSKAKDGKPSNHKSADFRASMKALDIRDLGHRVEMGAGVTEDGREYIQKKREEAYML